MKKRVVVLPIVVLLAVAVFCSVFFKATYSQPQKFESTIVSAASNTDKPISPNYDAKSALLMDFNTLTILHQQNIKERLPIASMSKIMTLLVIYDDIAEGKIAFDSDIVVSANAAGQGGSQAFIDANSVYKAEELIKSIVIASANDSCVALAEHLSGDVSTFVSRMNEKCKEFGLNDTNFVNCTGLPCEGQYSCAYDVAVMSKHLMSNPLFFEHSKIWMYDFVHPGGRVTGLTNTNKLVRFYEGCDGGKTGFTKEALSCLSATAKRGGTRLISVIIGAPNAKTRNSEVSKMFNFGFANYETKQVVFKGVEVGDPVLVDKGKNPYTIAVPSEDFFVLSRRGEANNIENEITINKVAAPVESGEVIGNITIKRADEVLGSVDLVSQNTVKKAGYLDMIDRLVENWG